MYQVPRRRNRKSIDPIDPLAPLYWGYNPGLPRVGDREGAAATDLASGWLAAWGARAPLLSTVKDGALVHLRYTLVDAWQSTAGPPDEVERLVTILLARGHDLWLAKANHALADKRLQPGTFDEITLFNGPLDGRHVTVKANHQGWDGWLLVCAYTTAA